MCSVAEFCPTLVGLDVISRFFGVAVYLALQTTAPVVPAAIETEL